MRVYIHASELEASWPLFTRGDSAVGGRRPATGEFLSRRSGERDSESSRAFPFNNGELKRTFGLTLNHEKIKVLSKLKWRATVTS